MIYLNGLTDFYSVSSKKILTKMIDKEILKTGEYFLYYLTNY